MGSASFMVTAQRDRYPDGLREVSITSYGARVMEQAYSAWPDAEYAMDALGDQDRYEHGHMSPDNVGGKHDLVHIATVADEDAATALAARLIGENDPRIADKRGPAGCITIESGDNQFLFFGFVAT